MTATVDMNLVQFYQPPSNPFCRQGTHSALSTTQTQAHCPIDPPTQAPSPSMKLDRALHSSDELELGIAAVFNKRDATESELETSKCDTARIQGMGGSSYDLPDNDSDDDCLPTVNELLQTSRPTRHAVAMPSNSEIDLEPLAQSAHDTTNLLTEQGWSISGGHEGGSRDSPMVIGDDESVHGDIEDETIARATSVDDHESNVERNSGLLNTPSKVHTEELRQPGALPHDWWYEIEYDCYIDEESPRCLDSREQEALVSSSSACSSYSRRSFHGSSPCRNNRDDDRSTSSEESAADSLGQHEIASEMTIGQEDNMESKHPGEDWQHQVLDEATDSDDEDPRLAKRRRVLGDDPAKDHSTTSKILWQFEAEYKPSSTLRDDEQFPERSQGSSPLPASRAVADYQEWAFAGFLKRNTIGSEMTYNLEFQLPHIAEHLPLPIHSKLHGPRDSATSARTAKPRNARASLRASTASSQPIRRQLWTEDEDATVLSMKKNGCSWEDIHRALPHRSKQTIQVRYSTKLKK